MPATSGLRASPSQSNVHWAFGSIALVLLLLNLATPGLLAESTPGGSILGEGTLYVSASSTGVFSFLVETLGHSEFERVVVALNLSAPSPPGNATTYRHWDLWSNTSSVVASTFNLTAVSFVVNVTAWYAPGTPAPCGSSPVATVGTFAFALAGTGSAATVTVTPIYPLVGGGALPGGASSQVWGLGDLPQSLALAQPPSTVTGCTPSAVVPASEDAP